MKQQRNISGTTEGRGEERRGKEGKGEKRRWQRRGQDKGEEEDNHVTSYGANPQFSYLTFLDVFISSSKCLASNPRRQLINLKS